MIDPQLQAILDDAPVGIVITRDGRLEVLSRQVCHMLGYPVEALRGQHARMLYACDADYESLGRRVRDEFAAHGAFDGDVCFITSANLTGHAMEQNMEAGVLLTGGKIPKLLHDHLQALVDTKTVSPI